MTTRSTTNVLLVHLGACVLSCQDNDDFSARSQPRQIETRSRALSQETADPQVRNPDPEPRYARHRERLAAHSNSPIDGEWANRMSPGVRSALEAKTKAATLHAQVRSLECRTASCAIVLEWSSYHEALQEYEHLLNLELPCERAIALPPPADPELAYEATMLATCAPPQ
jgi:hypothetical protein